LVFIVVVVEFETSRLVVVMVVVMAGWEPLLFPDAEMLLLWDD
jgi:hypothetical protein